MRLIPSFLVMLLVLTTGCGRPSAKKESAFTPVGAKVGAPGNADQKKSDDTESGGNEKFTSLPVAEPAQEGKKAAAKKQRKIRYTADMHLIVEKLETAEELLDAAKNQAKGEYAKVEVNTSTGIVRSGTWRIRVPVENLHTFRKAVAKIGDVERNTLDSDDITAQYYDLEAHIINRKVDQEVMREFLKEIGKKDNRYLEVKRELDTISDYISREEGKLKLWKDLTDLTTFTVHMKERQTYVPEAKVATTEIPTFGVRAETTWSNSWDNFAGFCQNVAIVVIWLAPWLPIALLTLLAMWLTMRYIRRKSEAPALKA